MKVIYMKESNNNCNKNITFKKEKYGKCYTKSHKVFDFYFLNKIKH